MFARLDAPDDGFSSENLAPGVVPRNEVKKKRRSSILKMAAKSPLRTALGDIDPNQNETDMSGNITTLVGKTANKRRSSRRVSFAESHQVKEFVKDDGVWLPKNESKPSGIFPNIEQENIGIEYKQKPSISDLETLLNGPIKPKEMESLSPVEKVCATSFLRSLTSNQSNASNYIWQQGPTTPGEVTRVFSTNDDTACMDLTNLNLSNKPLPPPLQNAISQQPDFIPGEATRIFSANEDTACMDMTDVSMAGKPLPPPLQNTVGQQQPDFVPGEATRIFSANEDTAHMDLTNLNLSNKPLPPPLQNAISQQPDFVPGEATRIFSANEDTACMDMTNLRMGSKPLPPPLQNAVGQQQPDFVPGEATRIFSANEDTACMDMTNISMSGKPAEPPLQNDALHQLASIATNLDWHRDNSACASPVVRQPVNVDEEDQTRHLDASMDLTLEKACSTANLTKSESGRAKVEAAKEVDSGVARQSEVKEPGSSCSILDSLDRELASMGGEEATCGSLNSSDNLMLAIERELNRQVITTPKSQRVTSGRDAAGAAHGLHREGGSPPEKLLSGTTANQEAAVPSRPEVANQPQPVRVQAQPTPPAHSGDTMELTCTVIPAGEPATSVVPSIGPKESVDQTRLFGEADGMMELTNQGGSIIPGAMGQPSCGHDANKSADHTQCFGEESMDLTNMTTGMSTGTTGRQIKSEVGQTGNSSNQTKCLAEESMDLTNMATGNFNEGQEKSGDGNSSNQTRFFAEESMDLTNMATGLSTGTTGEQVNSGDGNSSNQTKFFTEESMDLTNKATGISTGTTGGQVNSGDGNSSNQTKFFTEESMDLTNMAVGISTGGQVNSGDGNSSNQTKFFAEESMELTGHFPSSVGKEKSHDGNLNSRPEFLTHLPEPSPGKTSEEPPVSESIGGGMGLDLVPVLPSNTAASQEKKAKEEVEPSDVVKKNSAETFTLSPTISDGRMSAETFTIAPAEGRQQNSPLPATRQGVAADTFTVASPLTHPAIEGHSRKSDDHQPEEEVAARVPTFDSPSEGQGVFDGAGFSANGRKATRTATASSSSSTTSSSRYGFPYLPGNRISFYIEEEKTLGYIEDEATLDMEDLEQVTSGDDQAGGGKPTEPPPQKRGKMDSSVPSSPSTAMDRGNPHPAEGVSSAAQEAFKLSFLNNTSLAQNRSISTEEFLDRVGVSFMAIKKSRRSSFPLPLAMAAARSPGAGESLGDRLKLSLLTVPSENVHQQAVAHLTSKNDQLKTAINKMTTEMSENNPEIFQQLLKANPAEANAIAEKMNAQKKMCSKVAKIDWREEKGRILVQPLIGRLQANGELLKLDGAQISQDTQQLELKLGQLNARAAELEEAVATRRAGVASLAPPQEQAQRLADRRALVQAKREELKQLQQQDSQLEKQGAEDAAKLKEAEERLEALARDHQKLQEDAARKSAEAERAHRNASRIQGLVEWEMRACSQYGAEFAFMSGAITLSLIFGQTVEPPEFTSTGEPARRIVSVDLVSLEDNGSGSADPFQGLARRMVVEAVNTSQLATAHPTTKQLPLLLVEIESLVTSAQLLLRELPLIQFCHQTEVIGNSVKICFSSRESFRKFLVTFDLFPGCYPFEPLSYNFEPCIGQVGVAEVASAIEATKPGYNYLRRLTRSLDQVLNQQ